MTTQITRFRASAPIAVAGLALATLAACGSSGAGPSASPSSSGVTVSTGTPAGSGSGSGSGAAAPTQPPATQPGTHLRLGQGATLAWAPTQKASGLVRIKVTSMESTSYQQAFAGWKIPASQKTRAPYFVRAKVSNVGDSQLGGYAVPLYGLDDAADLVEATQFTSDFAPCQPGNLPKKFGPGASAKVCLVFLVPDKGKLTGVSYRPSEDFDPITWTGTVEKYSPAKPKSKATKSGKG